ncbi:MAG: VOC family protein [Anaerolineae bacterium]|nr:VOC family protein [Anaerolineae bacterium]
MFLRADHVALSVRDMAHAIAFYRDVIGMEVVFDREFDAPMARLIGEPGTRVRIVHMKLGDSVVELFDYRHPKGREPRPDARQSDYGLTHIGFIVEDFWGTYRRLAAQGVPFLGEPVEIRPGVHVAYFRGAEYEVCEMREIVPQ